MQVKILFTKYLIFNRKLTFIFKKYQNYCIDYDGGDLFLKNHLFLRLRTPTNQSKDFLISNYSISFLAKNEIYFNTYALKERKAQIFASYF